MMFVTRFFLSILAPWQYSDHLQKTLKKMRKTLVETGKSSASCARSQMATHFLPPPFLAEANTPSLLCVLTTPW